MSADQIVTQAVTPGRTLYVCFNDQIPFNARYNLKLAGQAVDLPTLFAFAALVQIGQVDHMPYRTVESGLNSSWFWRGDGFAFGRLLTFPDGGALLGGGDLVQSRL